MLEFSGIAEFGVLGNRDGVVWRRCPSEVGILHRFSAVSPSVIFVVASNSADRALQRLSFVICFENGFGVHALN